MFVFFGSSEMCCDLLEKLLPGISSLRLAWAQLCRTFASAAASAQHQDPCFAERSPSGEILLH